MLHLTCAIAVITTALHQILSLKKEPTEQSHLSQTWIRILTWATLLFFVSYEGTNEPLTFALQLSLLTTIAHEVSELCWHNKLSMLAYLTLILFSATFRVGGMWCIIARDPSNQLELVYIATTASLIVLTWVVINPATNGKPKLPLSLYSFATLMHSWLALDVVFHEDNRWYLLLVAASAIYVYSFYRFYVITYYRNNDKHLSCPPSSLILANLLMVITATLTT